MYFNTIVFSLCINGTRAQEINDQQLWLEFSLNNTFRSGKRFQAKPYVRFDERFIFYLSEMPNIQKSRLRIRPELIHPLNKLAMFQDKAFWL